jgi:hypothetical protein
MFYHFYVEKILEKAVFPEKITGKKGAFFCRRILPIILSKLKSKIVKTSFANFLQTLRSKKN